ncbi:hypothetical protein MNBD_BACTEROID01-2503 [hydrothermal vent metagenome]|uniref:PNPLA domain-containing protein n=1 Tax=hydrothermal vent metagenome TaxID=652676 RepID=A0A3B0UY81_9ZZZZ
MEKMIILILVLVMISILAMVRAKKKVSPRQQPAALKGTAIVITGAAARIPQEAALLERMYNSGMMDDVVFIAGASSGALNTVILNAILDKKLTWEVYKEMLFTLRNQDIYKLDGKKLPVDTRPLKNFLVKMVNDLLGYHKIGDLPITSAISITDIEILGLTKKNYRLSNRKINPESDPNLDLVEILMASTAFPVVFPQARISNATTIPAHAFIDGGIHEDHVPYKGLLDFIKYRGAGVERLYIVARKNNKKPELSQELETLGLNDRGILDKLGISIDDILFKGFIKGLKSLQKEAPGLAERTYVYIPDFPEEFLMLDFNNLEKQYNITKAWANTHGPVLLKEYLDGVKE